MHSDITFSVAAKGGLVNMSRKSLSAHAAALAAKLAMKCPCINMLRGLFEEIVDAVGRKHLPSDVMHETGLMKQIMDLAHV